MTKYGSGWNNLLISTSILLIILCSYLFARKYAKNIDDINQSVIELTDHSNEVANEKVYRSLGIKSINPENDNSGVELVDDLTEITGNLQNIDTTVTVTKYVPELR